MEAARRPIKHLVRSFAAGSAHATQRNKRRWAPLRSGQPALAVSKRNARVGL